MLSKSERYRHGIGNDRGCSSDSAGLVVRVLGSRLDIPRWGRSDFSGFNDSLLLVDLAPFRRRPHDHFQQVPGCKTFD